MKKRIILIAGPLASGKSTLSLKLAEELKVPVINKDIVKEILGDTIGFNNREENLKLSQATFKIFVYLSDQLMKNEICFILESNFRDYELETLFDLSKKYDYDLVTIVLDADTRILHERFMNRINSKKRNKVHMAVDLSDYNDFCDTINESRNVNYYGRVIKINTNNFEIDYQKLVRNIGNEEISNANK